MEKNKGKLAIDYNEVTNDPIQNYYKKIVNNVDKLIDDFFENFRKNKTNLLKLENENFSNISKINEGIEDKKRQLKIKSRKIQNVFILISCFLIIGLFFLKVYKKNKLIIKQYKSFYEQETSNINAIEKNIYDTSHYYFYILSFETILKIIMNEFGISVSNKLNNKVCQYIQNDNSFLSYLSALEFKYKNTSIINCCSLHLSIKNITTSNSMSFPYTEIESYVDYNGKHETRTVTKYETLTATHVEPTPFVIKKNNIYTITNFENSLDFTINNKKYLDFENNDFSKKYKINNNANSINKELLQFFTIKAQEDYLNFSNEFEKIKDIEFYKYNELIVSSCTENKIVNYVNYLYNFENYINNEEVDNINNIEQKIKNDLSNYIKDFAKYSSLSLISPAINRELYYPNGDYHISNNFEQQSVFEDDLSLEYIISKLHKYSSINFVTVVPDKRSWLTFHSANKVDQFAEINCTLNSYRKENLIDYVVVYGMHVGMQTIPVHYERFFDISEFKKIFFLRKKDNKVRFLMNKNLHYKLNDTSLHKNYILNNQVRIWIDELNNQKYMIDQNLLYQHLNHISDLIDDYITIESFNEGYAIIINDLNHVNNLNITKIKELIFKLSNIFS